MDGPEGTEASRAGGHDDEPDQSPTANPGATGYFDHRWQTAVLTKEKAGAKLQIRFVPSLESWEFRAPSVITASAFIVI